MILGKLGMEKGESGCFVGGVDESREDLDGGDHQERGLENRETERTDIFISQLRMNKRTVHQAVGLVQFQALAIIDFHFCTWTFQEGPFAGLLTATFVIHA